MNTSKFTHNVLNVVKGKKSPTETLQKLDREFNILINVTISPSSKTSTVSNSTIVSHGGSIKSKITRTGSVGGNSNVVDGDSLQTKIHKYLELFKTSISNTNLEESERLAWAEVYLTINKDNVDYHNDNSIVKYNDVKNKNMISKIIFFMDKLPFESKKFASSIITALLHKANIRQWNQKITSEALNYFENNTIIIDKLITYYDETKDHADALNAGEILKAMIKHAPLAKLVLDKHWETFLDLSNLQSFDMLSDSLAIFQDLLVRNKTVVSNFLKVNEAEFFKKFNEKLINSSNYVTKKTCIKLLSQILTERDHWKHMTNYVKSGVNLKVIMKALSDNSESIRFEAFHVFKIFIANPQKSERVLKILHLNKQTLITFLEKDFEKDKREDDEQFHSERRYLIDKIKGLPPIPSTSNQSDVSTVSTATNKTTVSTGTKTPGISLREEELSKIARKAEGDES